MNKHGIQSINTILVHIPKTYEDTIKLKSGTDLYLDTRFNDVRHTIRYGTVISSPDPRFAAGDTVYFHHNTVRRINTVEGNAKKYQENILDDIYEISSVEIYAIKRDGVFMAITPYCFIKPISKKQNSQGNIKIVSKEIEERQWGVVRYSNSQLREQGVEDGDIIIFDKDSEYEYPVDDEKLYRMRTEWIIAKICQ